MNTITHKQQLNENTISMDLDCPLIAKKALAGQFIIIRIDEYGERVPLTISAVRDDSTIRIVFQTIGKSTRQLGELMVGEKLLDVVGPLGRATELVGYKNVAVVVGGLGCAIGLFSAKTLFDQKTKVDIIAGFRNKDLIIMEEDMKEVCDNLYLCTDDGSYGFSGYVSDQLAELLKEKKYDLVLTIGPLLMMRAVVKVTLPLAIKTIASFNPIMVDGSGMCGCCRLTYDGEIKFACVDGPDFLADKVDFTELIARNNTYLSQEKAADEHYCLLLQARRNNHEN